MQARPPFTIDVVIPTFNESSRLIRALESALVQSSEVQKVVVVDDGSDPNIQEFLKRTLKNYPKAKLLSIPHSGHPGVARKEGIMETNSEWVAFLDADDVWLPNKLSEQITLALESGCDVIFTNAWRIEQSSKLFFEWSEFTTRPTLSGILTRNTIINSSVLVRREALESIGLFADSKLSRGAEDFATWLRLATSRSFAGTPKPLVEYHVHPNSFSKTSPSSARRNAILDWLVWLPFSKVSPRSKYVGVILAVTFLITETFLLTYTFFTAKWFRKNP